MSQFEGRHIQGINSAGSIQVLASEVSLLRFCDLEKTIAGKKPALQKNLNHFGSSRLHFQRAGVNTNINKNSMSFNPLNNTNQ